VRSLRFGSGVSASLSPPLAAAQAWARAWVQERAWEAAQPSGEAEPDAQPELPHAEPESGAELEQQRAEQDAPPGLPDVELESGAELALRDVEPERGVRRELGLGVELPSLQLWAGWGRCARRHWAAEVLDEAQRTVRVSEPAYSYLLLARIIRAESCRHWEHSWAAAASSLPWLSGLRD